MSLLRGEIVKPETTIQFDESMLENSFCDYHVKGFDYVCLSRTPQLTRKVYFFDGIKEDLPEVVCPHDHRYDFTTKVLAGSVGNYQYKLADHRTGVADVMQRFSYRTPLNGGNGFTWEREERLRLWRISQYQVGDMSYTMHHSHIHTIKVVPHTILLLEQFSDEPIEHTTTWTHSKEPINLSGLYNRFTADQLIKRLGQINELMA